MVAKSECDFEELVQSAYRHIVEEVGLDNVRPSFGLRSKDLQKAHDSIHEFMFLVSLLFPSQADRGVGWHKKSAFLTYHWEAFHHAHRSLIEALCAYYNAAFILLRSVLELVIKGAFWECLSHKEFRENSRVLDTDPQGRKIKEWLAEIFEVAPDVEEVLERISASIYDKVSTIVEDPSFRPPVKVIVRQLDQWGIFNPLPDPVTSIYDEIYGTLSADVHVVPDRTDIGKRMVAAPDEILEQKLLQSMLGEYANYLHQVMDLAIVVELNIMRDLVDRYNESRSNLRGRLDALEQLGLEHSLARAKELVK